MFDLRMLRRIGGPAFLGGFVLALVYLVDPWNLHLNDVIVGGRDRGPVPDLSVVLAGSPEFDQRVAASKVSVEEAERIRSSSPESMKEWRAADSRCHLMDGDWYVFTSPPIKTGLPLGGVYIHSMTSETKWIFPPVGLIDYDLTRRKLNAIQRRQLFQPVKAFRSKTSDVYRSLHSITEVRRRAPGPPFGAKRLSRPGRSVVVLELLRLQEVRVANLEVRAGVG